MKIAAIDQSELVLWAYEFDSLDAAKAMFPDCTLSVCPECVGVGMRINDFDQTESQDVSLEKSITLARAIAYKNESDPLFFKEQRCEVPVGSWLAKVDEIKARYPK